MSGVSSSIMHAHLRIKALEKALEPFAHVADILGRTPPPGMDNILHQWSNRKGTAAVLLSDCVVAFDLLAPEGQDPDEVG